MQSVHLCLGTAPSGIALEPRFETVQLLSLPYAQTSREQRHPPQDPPPLKQHTDTHPTMSAILGRAVSRAGPSAFRMSSRTASTAEKGGKDTVLQKGARRDPELYVRI